MLMGEGNGSSARGTDACQFGPIRWKVEGTLAVTPQAHGELVPYWIINDLRGSSAPRNRVVDQPGWAP